MNTSNKLKFYGALLTFMTLILAISARAQPALGVSHAIQEEARESPDRHESPGADTTRRLLFWNGITLKANALDHARVPPFSPDQGGPLRTARAFAIVHIAMFDAYNAIVGGFESYTGLNPASLDEDIDRDRSRASEDGDRDNEDSDRDKHDNRDKHNNRDKQDTSKASIDAAIDQAAGDTLIALFPSQADDIEAIQSADLKTIPNGPAKAAGIRIGQQAADAILALRSNDGSQQPEELYNVPGGYIPNPAIGKWRQDPISQNPVALGAFWNKVKPFVILSADQFSVISPPALTSAAYAKAFDELKRLGGDGVVTPTERTSEQTIIGIFWAYDGTPFLGTNPRLYNQITVKISEQMGTRGIELARLLALVNVAMADAGLACFTTKYSEEFWRPITAIRQGANDNNPDTIGDPNFVPLGAPASNTTGPNFTPNFPSYTAGHSTFGGALFQTLRRFYQTDNIAFSIVSDEFNGKTRDNQGNVRPRIRRRFNSLSDAEAENGMSRIYLGIHWSFDNIQGISQGNRVADFVFDNSFRRRSSGED
ncbi:MAG: phosphatase PAP2 family protein [Chloracidobacterium sp.]|nr:phosphatase PAP2 family protein [Chloracidobacterium sp.]